jgi:hypothetical protein
MFRSFSPSRSRGAHRGLLIGVLCALLIAFSTTVRITHGHDAAGTSHSSCSLCLVAHAGIAPQAPAVMPAAIEHTAEIEILRPDTPRNSFLLSFYTRPPPADAASI